MSTWQVLRARDTNWRLFMATCTSRDLQKTHKIYICYDITIKIFHWKLALAISIPYIYLYCWQLKLFRISASVNCEVIFTNSIKKLWEAPNSRFSAKICQWNNLNSASHHCNGNYGDSEYPNEFFKFVYLLYLLHLDNNTESYMQKLQPEINLGIW